MSWFADSWNGKWLDSSYCATHEFPWNQEKDVRMMDIFWRYATERYSGAYEDEGYKASIYHDSLSAACDGMDYIIDGIQDNMMYDPSFAGYMLNNEVWGRNDSGSHFADADKCFVLGRYAINRIRARDHSSPILIQHRFMHALANPETEVNGLDDVDLVFRSSDPDVGFGGWNIFSNFDHIHDNTVYAGQYYYEQMWKKLHFGHRELMIAIQDYADSSQSYLQGPAPEWWQCLSLERKFTPTPSILDTVWGISGDNGWAGKRRVTKNEITMEAYSALAAGAKGITLWPYFSNGDITDFKPYFPIEDEVTPFEFESDVNYYDDELYAEQYDELDEVTRPNSYRSKPIYYGLTNPQYTYTWDGRLLDSLINSNDSTIADAEWDRVYGNVSHFMQPMSESELCDDNDFMAFDELYQPSSGHYYPYDVVKNMYTELDTLLPIMRNLRWWWLVNDGPLNSYTDAIGFPDDVSYPIVKGGLGTYYLCDTLFSRFGVEGLSNRFNLFWSDAPEAGGYSKLIVGMFGNPDEGDIGNWDGVDSTWLHGPEYYLLVNQECNTSAGGGEYTDASESTFQLWFKIFHNDPSNAILTTLWAGHNDDSFVDSIYYDDLSGDYFVDIQIAAGDAILLKLETSPNTIYSSAVTYSSTTTVNGPIHYEDNVRVDGATVTFDGHFEFKEDLIIDNLSTVYINEGSTLCFDRGKKVHVVGSSKLIILGDENKRVLLTTLGKKTRKGWDGIWIESSGDTVRISNTDIEYAKYGIIAGTKGSGHQIFANNCKFNECSYALSLAMNIATLDSCLIHNCDYGARVLPAQNCTQNWTAFRGCTFENIDNYGIDFNGLYKAYAPSSLFQNIGGPAIQATDTYQLFLNEGTALYPGKPVEIRNTCLDANYDKDAAVVLDDTKLYYYNNTKIYDNALAGLRLENGSSLNNTNVFQHENFIGYNYDENKYPPYISGTGTIYPTASQILLYDNCMLAIPYEVGTTNRSIDILSRRLDPDYPMGSYSISRPDSVMTSTLQMSGIFWGGAVTDHFVGAITLFPDNLWGYFNCSPSRATAWYDEDDYWGYREFSDDLPTEPSEWEAFAYNMVDTLATDTQYEQANEILHNAYNNGNNSALFGIVNIMEQQGYTTEEINNHIRTIMDRNNRRNAVSAIFTMGSVYRKHGCYEDALSTFEAFADTIGNDIDSLKALIQMEKTNRIAAINGEDCDYGVYSHGNSRDRTIELAEKRISDLYKEVHRKILNSIANNNNSLPTAYALQPAYPNPFNPSVNIPFALPSASDVRLTVYNVLGQRVNQLVNRKMVAGYHQVIWNGHSQSGLPVASGVYFVTMEAGGFVKTQKIVMVK